MEVRRSAWRRSADSEHVYKEACIACLNILSTCPSSFLLLPDTTMAYPSLVEVDNIEIVVLVNDEIDYISPSPNAHVKHTQSFRGAPVDVIPDPASRGGAKVEFPMRNLCCGALGLSLLIVR